jgi:hypothetical protein
LITNFFKVCSNSKCSIDIFYSILSGRRPLTHELALIIGDALNFDGNIIFNINYQIPSTIKNSSNLNKFRQENSNNLDYFTETWSEQKASHFIKLELIQKDFFNTPKYTWEVNEQLKSLGKKINSNLLNKHLKYLVEKNLLKSKRAPLKRKNGDYGTRMVEVYYK